MRYVREVLLMMATSSVLTPLVARAHHSLSEIYVRDSSITLTGTITGIDWVNPHVVFRLEVDDGSGPTVSWLVEMDPPHALSQRSWSRNSIDVGQIVTVDGYRAIADDARTEAKTITLPGGETLVASTDGSWNWTQITGSAQLLVPRPRN